MKAIRLLASAAALLILPIGLNAQEKAPEKKLDKAEIEAIVKEYILAHPEVLLESVRLHEQRERTASVERGRKAVATHAEELLRDEGTPWLGAKAPEATVVQFFDYRCGYCKRAFPMITEAAKKPGVRVVYKELPILGPESVQAARLALAAQKQGKYREVHEALMAGNPAADNEAIERLAAQHSMDAAKLKKDMESAEVSETLNRNQALAMALGVNSTPTFVIGTDIIPGVLPPDQFNQQIERSRKKAPAAEPR